MFFRKAYNKTVYSLFIPCYLIHGLKGGENMGIYSYLVTCRNALYWLTIFFRVWGCRIITK